MTRREAREQAFILVFEQAIRGEPMDAILHDAAEARDLVPSAFAEQEALGVEAHREEIDSVIEQHIPALEKIVADYCGDLFINTTRILINR